MKKLIFILFTIFFCEVKAQVVRSSAEIKNDSISNNAKFSHQELRRSFFELSIPQNRFLIQQAPAFTFLSLPYRTQGMFCKMEYKIETKSKLAPRFRLGSLNYTEWMEGKRELYSRYWK